MESQTSASGEGKPAPGAGVDEKITSRGRKQREEASKETAPKEISGGKTAAEDLATREKGAKELARLNQRADMVTEAAQRKILTDFFNQQNAGHRELLQREALPDAEFETEVERLGQIKEVKDRMLEAAKKIGRSIGVSVREGVENAGRGQCLFETVSSQILERKSKDGRKFQFLIDKYGEDFFTPSNLRAGTVALLENSPAALGFFNWEPEGIGSQETLSLEQRRAELQKQLDALKRDGQYAYAAGDLLLPGLSAYLGLHITLIGTSAPSPPLQLIRPQALGGDESLCAITPILLAFDERAQHYEDFWPEDEESESALMAATLDVMQGRHWPQIMEAQESTRQGSTAATTQTSSSAATSSTERAAADKVAAERAAAKKTEEEKAEVEDAAREKAAAEKVAREKAAAERVAAKEAQEEKTADEKAAAEKVAREKAAAERLPVKKAQEEKAAVEKAAAEKVAREKAAAERVPVKKAQEEKGAATTSSIASGRSNTISTVYKFENPGTIYLCWNNSTIQALFFSSKPNLERELRAIAEQSLHLPGTKELVKMLNTTKSSPALTIGAMLAGCLV